MLYLKTNKFRSNLVVPKSTNMIDFSDSSISENLETVDSHVAYLAHTFDKLSKLKQSDTLRTKIKFTTFGIISVPKKRNSLPKLWLSFGPCSRSSAPIVLVVNLLTIICEHEY